MVTEVIMFEVYVDGIYVGRCQENERHEMALNHIMSDKFRPIENSFPQITFKFTGVAPLDGA